MAYPPTIPELIQIITECECEMKVCVPAQDYYARSTDWDTDTIRFLDTRYFIEKLTEIYDAHHNK